LQEEFLAKRRRRQETTKQTEQEEPTRDNGVVNEAYEDENYESPDEILPKSDILIDSRKPGESVARKHRDKSRELSRKIQSDTNPNEVAQEMGAVRDKIQNIIKSKLTEQLSVARSEQQSGDGDDDDDYASRPAAATMQTDLKLDLSSAMGGDLNASQTQAKMSTTFRIEQLMKQIKVSHY
jgi:hypothetical protein